MGLSLCDRFMATCSSDNIIRIWDIESRCNLLGFKDHKEGTTYIQFYHNKKRPEENYFATTAFDGRINVYPLIYRPAPSPSQPHLSDETLPTCVLGDRIEI